MGSVKDWKGESIDIKTWNQLRDIACILGGPNPAARSDQSYSQKHYEYVCGRTNGFAAFGKLGQEMIDWLIQLQHIKDKDIIFTAALKRELDEFNRQVWTLQCEGNKTANEIPCIVDEVISMVGLKNDEGKEVRSFVCHTLNPWGYPAKDRSSYLNMVEKPHLGELLTKIKSTTQLTV